MLVALHREVAHLRRVARQTRRATGRNEVRAAATAATAGGNVCSLEGDVHGVPTAATARAGNRFVGEAHFAGDARLGEIGEEVVRGELLVVVEIDCWPA